MGRIGINYLQIPDDGNDTGIGGPNCAGDLVTDITVLRPTDTPNTGWANQLVDSSTLSGDVVFCFTIGASIPNTPNMIGLNSDIATDASYASIDYSFYVYENGGTRLLRIYENSAFRLDIAGGWDNGDVCCIKRTGTQVTYEVNNVLVYTSTVASANDLGVDSSFYYAAGTWGSGSMELLNMSLCNQ